MKKLGLLSIAAAVALTSSAAIAAELKVGADATIKGYSVRDKTKEAKEYYNQEVNLNVVMKNDDGITMKAGWVVFDGYMQDTPATSNNAVTGTATGTPIVAPALDYGYIIAPLSDALTLKAGFVEAGSFGTAFTNGGSSVFKPFALNYKMGDMNIGLEEHMRKESNAANKNGGTIGAAGDGEKSSTRVYVKGKAGDLGWGVRHTITQVGEDNTTNPVTKAYSDSQTELYVVGSAAGLNVAGHYVAQAKGKEGVKPSSTSGLYAHALMPMGNLTAGVAIAMLNDGFTAGAEFDPTYITDVVLGSLPSSYDAATSKSKNTSLTVVPVIYKINDMLTFDGSFTTGKITDASYTEIDAGLNVALGKVTNLKVMYANGTGDAVKVPSSATASSDIDFMGWKLSTEF